MRDNQGLKAIEGLIVFLDVIEVETSKIIKIISSLSTVIVGMCLLEM